MKNNKDRNGKNIMVKAEIIHGNKEIHMNIRELNMRSGNNNLLKDKVLAKVYGEYLYGQLLSL